MTKVDTVPDIDVDLDAEVPCVGYWCRQRPEGPNVADFIVSAHATLRYSLCRSCWTEAGRHLGYCKKTRQVESRDQHLQIVEVLR